jgi:hypothetical protein
LQNICTDIFMWFIFNILSLWTCALGFREGRTLALIRQLKFKGCFFVWLP